MEPQGASDSSPGCRQRQERWLHPGSAFPQFALPQHVLGVGRGPGEGGVLTRALGGRNGLLRDRFSQYSQRSTGPVTDSLITRLFTLRGEVIEVNDGICLGPETDLARFGEGVVFYLKEFLTIE